MARIRTIKPDFWTSEQVVDCSPTARLLFVGMWNFCDDFGIHPASARKLKMEVFPEDDFTTDDIRGMVAELVNAGLLILYFVNGEQFWQVTGWHHQKIEKKTKRFPQPDFDTPSSITRRIVVASSAHPRLPLDYGREGKGTGREGKGTGREEETERKGSSVAGGEGGPGGEPRKPKPAKRKCQLPADWSPKPSHASLACDLGVVMPTEATKFREHAAATGRLMLDWDACFNTWLRNARRFGGPTQNGNGHRQPTRSERVAAAGAEVLRMLEEQGGGK